MRSQSRAGFTLIELMVALALTMFLMIILTQCFVLSLETFSGMKGLGDMQQNLRTATTLLASDLAEDHFEGKRRLSDPTIFNSAYPIQAGYFAIRQGSAPVSVSTVTPAAPPAYILEGADNNGIPSYRAVDQVLAFTVKRKGNRAENFFTAAMQGNAAAINQFFFPLGNNTKGTAYNLLSQPFSSQVGGSVPGYPPPVLPKGYVPPPSFTTAAADLPSVTFTTPYTGGTIGFYSSQWAEVYYYLVRTGSTEEPSNPASALGTPIYSLYRAQFVMVPDGTVVNTANAAVPAPATRFTWPASALTPFQGFSTSANPFNPGNVALMNFNSPIDAANSTSQRVLSLATVLPLNDPLQRFTPGTGTGTSEGAAAGQSQGSTELVLPNVLSFQVQLLDTNTNLTSFGDVPPVAPFNGVYDSTTLQQLNQAGTITPFSIKAIRVTLRVWDNATRQTRQTSITQDL